jgi:hypothetical protein
MARKSSNSTRGTTGGGGTGGARDTGGRPFGADYVAPKGAGGSIDRRALPDGASQRLEREGANGGVQPIGADHRPSGRRGVDLRARPDLVRGPLGEADLAGDAGS